MNPYKEFLDLFFTTVNEYYHFSTRVSKVLRLDAERFTAEGAVYESGTALVVHDWTFSPDDVFPFNFHSRIFKNTTKEGYFEEIDNVTSLILSSYFIHCYEEFEKFLKKVVRHNCSIDSDFMSLTMLKNKMGDSFDDRKIKGDLTLYKLIESLCKPLIHEYSKENHYHIRFRSLFTILSKSRNAMVHSQNVILKSTVLSNQDNKNHFNYLFNYLDINSQLIKIVLPQEKFSIVIKTYAEFAFQIYKMISIRQGHPIIYNAQ